MPVLALLAFLGCVTDTQPTGSNPEVVYMAPTGWKYAGFCIRDADGDCDDNGAYESNGVFVADCLSENDVGPYTECVMDALNELGADGWELLAPGGEFTGLESNVVYVLERAIWD